MQTLEILPETETEETLLPPFSESELKKCRHKHENALWLLCFFISFMAAVIAVIMILAHQPELNEGANFFVYNVPLMSALEEAEPEEDYIGEFYNNYSHYMWVVLFTPLMLFIALHLLYAHTRAFAVRVTPKNFPEIYQKSVEFAELLNLKKTPPVYIEQRNGRLNAFAAAIIGRRYALLNAELVDIAYMENKDFEPIYFVLAHEFGHIYFRHVTIWYNIRIFVAHMIPIIGHIHMRSMEYSCDRIAQLLTGSDGVNELMVFVAGRHLYKYVDAEDYMLTVKTEKGFFLRVTNLLSSHPIMPKRMAALADPEKKSGKLL
jgi:Zn-dependent protease with chaperone function